MRGVTILFFIFLGTFSSLCQSYKSEIKALIIPVEFQDVKFTLPNPVEHIDSMFNSIEYSSYNSTGSVSQYFNDNLAGIIPTKFEISPIATLPKESKYYGQNQLNESTGGTIYDVKSREMLDDACRAVDLSVDFSNHNIVFLICAGYSEAEGGGEDAIWPMSLDISNRPITLDGANIQVYGCALELRGSVGSSPAGIGPICHEFGHILGLPDLYDVDGELNGRGNAMWGTLSLMGYGCYNNKGKTPPYMNAIERELILERLGKEVEIIDSYTSINTSYTLEPINKGGRFLRVNTLNKGEYFLLEVREEAGWDSYIGGEGLLIYHIDKSNNPAGRILASTRWQVNLINSYAEHECAHIVKALPSATNVRQVFFPGVDNITSFGTLTTPHFVDWTSRGVGIKLINIHLNDDGSISFDVKADNDEILPSAKNIIIKSTQYDATLSWSSTEKTPSRWHIRFRGEEEEFSTANSIMVEDSTYSITSLQPGVRYYGEIFYMGYNNNGDTTKFRFRTKEITSPFPYIEGIRSSFDVGDSAKLHIYNLNEMAQSITWYLNGVQIKDGIFRFIKEGKNEVKVKIKYSNDGSEEVIKRVILVGKKEENENEE